MEKSAVTKSHRASRHQAEELVLCPEGTGRTGSRVGRCRVSSGGRGTLWAMWGGTGGDEVEAT